ncbi:homoserine O-acetyltransferase/O-succinyltransferase family protein, partial [Salmonella enterica]|uniref:homoserine O-acetyltransferase/O-succinyltransferase family protein n=1 Tax=Salmonella enterica TaxID=28901 RepID=UPI00398C6CAA
IRRGRGLAKDVITARRFVCWGGPAALNNLAGIPKHTRTDKLSGVYEPHILHPHALLTRGFDDSFLAPHSRYADFPEALIRDYTDLEILAETEDGDSYLFARTAKRIAFVPRHPEIAAHTLFGEYFF